MKSVKKMLAVAAALAMVGAPVVASASPASKLSISQANSAQTSKVRAGTNVKKSSELGGSVALAVLAAAAVIGGIILAASGGSNSP
jgi:hypothetical protein